MSGKFDARLLEKAVGAMVEVSIGDSLTTIKRKVDSEVLDSPSVIYAKETSINGKIAYPPEYPFAMIETTGSPKDHRLIGQYLTEPDANGNVDQIFETTVTARVNIKIYGTRSDDIESIISDLDQAFTVDDFRDLIDKEYGGARWVGTSETLTSYNTINNIYQGVASIDAYFSVIRQYTQKDIETFDSIEGDFKGLLHVGDVPLGE